MQPASAYSIRKRLLLVLGLLVSFASATETMFAYHRALREVDGMADAQMAQIARALRRDPAEHNAPASQIVIEGNPETGTFRVQLTPRTDNDPFPPFRDWAGSQRAFSNTTQNGKVYRVFTTWSRTHKIEVMHDMDLRAVGARHLALHIMLPFFIISPLLLLAVWLGISVALRPLYASRNEIGKRDANDLSPLSISGVPAELLPFVQEINALFERVSQAFVAQKNFVADAAHELRSPLAALRLQVQGLQKAGSDESRQIAAERLTTGIDRASRLVEQMLILAREDSAINIQEELNLADITRLAISDVLPLAQAREIDIGATLPLKSGEDGGTMKGNPDALRIMLGNLLDNAVKYSPHGGIVDVSLKTSGEGIQICIEDNGPGIPETETARVFERFHRISDTSQNAVGSGLGLAIVKTIADRHHIRLSFGHSASLGGLAVILHFPRTLPAV